MPGARGRPAQLQGEYGPSRVGFLPPPQPPNPQWLLALPLGACDHPQAASQLRATGTWEEGPPGQPHLSPPSPPPQRQADWGVPPRPPFLVLFYILQAAPGGKGLLGPWGILALPHLGLPGAHSPVLRPICLLPAPSTGSPRLSLWAQ